MTQREGWKGVKYQSKGGSQAATKAFNITISTKYLNSEYEIDQQTEAYANNEGLLLLARLTPKQKSLPEYRIRWDEKADHVNVDMIPEENGWKSEKSGYQGHQLKKAKNHPGRAFILIINTPTTAIIEGIVTFNLARDVEAKANVGIHATLTAKIVKTQKRQTN